MDKVFNLGINSQPDEEVEIQSGKEIDSNDDESKETYVKYPELEIEITSENDGLLESLKSGKAIIEFDLHSFEEIDEDDYGYSPDAKSCIELKIRSIKPIEKSSMDGEKVNGLSDALDVFVRNKSKE